MRPKVVILILLMAGGLVALAAAIKIMSARHGAGGDQATAPAGPAPAPAPEATAPVPGSGAAINQQLRAADVDKQVEQIHSFVQDGPPSPATLGILISKVADPEPAVRTAALEAVVTLNDTNAIPGLEQAAQAVDNPKDKAAIMDAVAYLKLPDPMSDAAMTNPPMVTSTTAAPWDVQAQKVMQKQKIPPRSQRHGFRPKTRNPPAAAPTPAQAQPAAPAPDSAPPQAQPAPPAPDSAPPQ